MKKNLLLIVLFSICIIPNISKAYSIENENFESETKYYKTITYSYNYNILFSNLPLSNTEEISEEEYNMVNFSDASTLGTVETTYKKMTTSIERYNSYYRYKVILEWKNMPSTRSYDIIAIGFLASVKPYLSLIFENRYCTSSSNCSTSSSYSYSYSGRNGVGIAFKVPTGTLSSMTQTLYVNMIKNTSSTIVAQYAYGDYAHATESISLDDAKHFTVDTSGIVHNSNSSGYFDAISPARAVWTGTW